jgi:Na+-transporting methylmalonyl-CoA/oxaloacetate decarboxylase gamma subunit
VIELLSIGLQLTVFGMGLVFLLLAVLWGLMTLLLRLDQAPAPTQPTPPQAMPDPDKLAAITIAVLLHRTARRAPGQPAPPPPGHWADMGRIRQNRSWHPQRR